MQPSVSPFAGSSINVVYQEWNLVPDNKEYGTRSSPHAVDWTQAQITRSVSTLAPPPATALSHHGKSPQLASMVDEVMIDVDEVRAYEAAVLRAQAADPRIAKVSGSSCATYRGIQVLTVSN
jgi:hypothetical protein